MHRMSGSHSATHDSTRSKRALSELTFHVATLTADHHRSLRSHRRATAMPAGLLGWAFAMQVKVWSDYICPWCYLGRDRTALLRSLDVEVTQLPFELHPDLAPSARPVKATGRLAAVYASIEQECDALSMPFRAPTHVPNSRRALETAELVRLRWPEAFTAVDDALFEAHFVRGLDIGDSDVLRTLVKDAGAPATEVSAALAAGDG